MGTASRKTWLEKQSNDIQFDVLNWDESGNLTLQEMVARLKAEFGLDVPVTTLHNSLQVMHADGGVRILRMLHAYLKRNPEVNTTTLTKAFTFTRAASEEFRRAKLDPTGVLISAQQERKLDIAEIRAQLEERKVAAQEDSNRIKREALELDRRRVDLMERKLPKVKEELEGAAKEAEAAAREGKAFDAREAIKKISALIGVGTPMEERVEPGS